DLEVLGLEVRGNAAKNVQQSLVLRPRINLVGRNEIRLASHSTLTINGGSVSSLRWVDILAGAALNGNGSITGTVYNNGTVAVTGDDSPTLRVDGHYHQTADATLAVAVSGSRESFEVNGEAKLDGRLDIVIGEGFEPTRGESYSVLTAHQIAGKFANANDELVASDGTRFVINYSPSAVSLTAK
ncbi:MAG: hypothetical protein QF805_03810, partial [Pirellulaceae bacterium]|nr:hypothetical protein [Pirellulaceae bacterium]